MFAAVLLAATAVLPSIGAPGVHAASALRSNLVPASNYADLSTPKAHILFGSPLPKVEILPTTNASLGATLRLDYVLEIAPNLTDPSHPLVVREAAPQTLQQFNGTISLHGTPNYVNLIATLPVYPASTSLWAHGPSILPASGIPKQAILGVNYSVSSGSDGSPGVLLSWSVSGWPWANPTGDELALEYVVEVVSGSGFETCAGVPSTNAPSAQCTTQALTPGQAVWGPTMTALKGLGPAGSVAWVSWTPRVSGDYDQSTPVSAGAYLEEPGTSALVIAAPDDGAQAVTGATLFLLAPGPVGGLVGPLVGNLPAYGGAMLVFAGAAGVGIVAYRRRDRAIEHELSA